MPCTRLRTETGDMEGTEEVKAFRDGQGILLFRSNLLGMFFFCVCVLPMFYTSAVQLKYNGAVNASHNIYDLKILVAMLKKETIC